MTTTSEVLGSAVDLDPEVRSALRRHIVTLADSKRLMGIRYSDWVLGAPSIEADIATSAMAQDEWGHARLLYAMLKDFGEDPTAAEHDRDASAYANVDPLDSGLTDWASVVAAMVLVDGALAAALDGFAAGRYEQARSRVPKMVAEEEFHRDLGLAWFRRLADGSAEAGERLLTEVKAMAPRTLAWLAPDDEPFGLLVGAGLVESGEALLAHWHRRCEGVTDRIGVTLGDVVPDRTEWDTGRGRGPGRPDDGAVERARGDRNRALFVE
jgi:phenylacetate-CoA oxygenase PaaI subunit